MASTDKKKVKITETSKQANVDITSETIQLPADSADHVLVAKVPSNANCTSGVNVEVEMSPDGENWCPALRKETVTTPGASTSQIIGNEKYVDLQKNDPVFNSYAKGGLNFDVNGNEVALGTGARDLLDQHIAVDKSFNHSMWIKSDTLPDIAQNETVTFTVTVSGGLFYINGVAQSSVYLKEGSTYTFDQSDSSNSGHPLRFSTTSDGTHGSGSEYTTGVTTNGTPGTAGAHTQIVVAENAVDLYYYCSNHSGMGGSAFTPANKPYKPVLFRHGGYDTFENAKTVELNDSSAVTVPTKYLKGYGKVGSTNNGNNAYGSTQNPYASSGTSVPQKRTIAFWLNPGAPTSDFTHYIYTEQFGGGKAIAIALRRTGGLMFMQVNEWDGTYFEATATPSNTILSSQWQHIVVSLDGGSTGTTNAGTKNAHISINGGTQPMSSFNAGSVTGNTSLSLSNVAFQATAGSSAISGLEHMGIDEFTIFEGAVASSPFPNTAQFIIDLYNSGSYVDPTTISLPTGVTLKRYLKIGDDEDSVSLFKSYAGITGDFFVRDSSATSTSLVDNPSFNPTYYTYTQNQPKTQNLSQEISFSNTKLANGRSQDTNYQARIGDPYQDWTVCFWWTPFNEANGVDSNPAPSVEYYATNRFRIEAGYYVSGTNSRVSIAFGWWNLGISSGTAPYYFTYQIAYPMGGTYTGNEAEVKNGSFFYAVTNSYNSTTGVTTTTGHVYKSDGTRIYNNSYTFTATSTMPTISNFLDHPDETICYSRALTDAEIQAHFGTSPTAKVVDSSGNPTTTPAICPVDVTKLSTFSDAIVYLRGGDADGDTATTMQNLAPSNSHFPASFTGTFTHKDLGTSKGNYLVSSDNQDLFLTTSNTSISGWFKTTSTGTLFSNTEGAAATGLKLDVNAADITLSLLNSSQSIIVSSDVDDGNWHHILITKSSIDLSTNQCEFKIYVDGALETTSSKVISDDDLKGSNGFTLLGDGQNNANAALPDSVDLSKLQASVSNWSLHSEVLDANAAKQLYSNGHVRNINNLPSVTASAIEAWWQLNDSTNPQNDVSGNSKHFRFQAPGEAGNDTAISGPPTHELGGVYKEENNGGLLSPNSTFNDYSSSTGTQQTYNCWIYKPSSFSGDLTWYGDFTTPPTGSTTAGYGLVSDAIYGRELAFYHNNGGQYNYVGYASLPSGYEDEWVMVTIVTDTNTSNIKMYLKSASTNNYSNPATGSLTGGWTNWSVASTETITKSGFLGARTWNGGVYPSSSSSMTTATCKIDEFSAFNRALTLTEIEELYTNQNPLTHSRSSDVYRYIRFGNGSGDSESSLVCQVDSNFVLDKSSSASGTYSTTLTSADAAYTEGPTPALSTKLVNADGATLVEKSINGNAMTLSLTKNFNFTTESWVSDASGEAALCLSLNGFEEQAEYFALWKCTQTLPDGVVDVCDGNWHNIALSYRGQNDLAGNNVAEGDAARFGRGSSDNPFNFSLAIDGYPLYTEIANNTGADYIGGNNALLTDTINSVTYNVGFSIYNRHLKYDPNNNNEQYRVHGQFGSGVHTYLANETDPHSFRGEVDETSFHTDPWWSNADGTNIDVFGSDTSKRGNLFNQEKTYTLYGRTTALANRGANARYPLGVPYPLLNPELLVNSGNITDIEGTNQFLNPVRKGDTQSWDSQASAGGLEGWWRWGDTPGDCSITVNDVKDHGSTPAVDYRDIDAVYLTDQGTSSNVVLATNESIYLASQAASTTPGSASVQYNQIKLENLSSLVGTAACAVKDFVSPVLQYLRIKLTGTGTCDIGDGKLEIEVNHKKRRMK